MLLVDHPRSPRSNAYAVLGLCYSHPHIVLFIYRITVINLSIETGMPEKNSLDSDQSPVSDQGLHCFPLIQQLV